MKKQSKYTRIKKILKLSEIFLGWLEEMEGEEYDAISEVAETVNLYDAVSNIYKAVEEDHFE